ncbi:hypothetical protein Tco_0810723, partial [Tanacetum coccineum]
VNAVDMLAAQNNYPPNVACPGSSLFGDINSIHINGEWSRNNLNAEGHLWPTADSKGPVILDFENHTVHLPSIMGASTGFQIANNVDMLTSKNNYPPNVDHFDSPLFGAMNSIHSNGKNSTSNVAHKPIQTSNNVDSRKRRNTEWPPLSNVASASTRTYVDSNCEGVSSNVGSRIKNRRGREPLANVISQGMGSGYSGLRSTNSQIITNVVWEGNMTSFGARVEDSINNGRAPYVFKISGEVYHWIGSLCPNEGDPPRQIRHQRQGCSGAKTTPSTLKCSSKVATSTSRCKVSKVNA